MSKVKKVKKPKFRSAEHKRVYEENQRSWEELKAKYDTGKPVRPVSNVIMEETGALPKVVLALIEGGKQDGA